MSALNIKRGGQVCVEIIRRMGAPSFFVYINVNIRKKFY